MPYRIERQGKKFCVFNKDTGENKGCSDSMKMAKAHMRAMYAAEGGGKMSKKELDDLVTKSLEDSGIVPEENGNDEEKGLDPYSYAYPYPYMGATSFAELDDMEFAQEISEDINELSAKFDLLKSNIMSDPEIADKGSAIEALSGEFSSRLKDISSSKTASSNDDPGNKEKGGWLDRVVAKVISAINPQTNKEKCPPCSEEESDGMMIWKEADGRYAWIARYSNKFRDDDNPPEIISDASHKRFADRVEKGLDPLPELWLWHRPELKFGEATWVAYDDSGFALAGGFIDDDKKELADYVARQKDVLVSHGMPPLSIKRDAGNPSIIIEHTTREISPLPAWAAANKITGFVILDSKEIQEDSTMIPEQKKKALTEKWGIPADLLEKIEKSNAAAAEKATNAGIESKEVAETPAVVTKAEGAGTDASAPVQQVEAEARTEETQQPAQAETQKPAADPATPAETPVTRTEIAEAIVAVVGPMADRLEEMGTLIEALSKELKAVNQTQEEKAKSIVASTPTASLASMVLQARSAVRSPETAIDGRSSLAKSHPKEAKSSGNMPTGISFIDSMIAGNEQ